MNTPAQCGVIKPPKPDIYSEAPQTVTALDIGSLSFKDAVGVAGVGGSGSHGCGGSLAIRRMWA